MKKLNYLVIASMVVMLLTSCGGGSQSSNEILGKLPSMTKTYIQEVEEKEKAMDECTDLEKAFKIEEELTLLEEKNETKIQEYIDANKFEGKEIPVEIIPSLPYTINKAEINLVQPGNLNIKFSVTIKEDIMNSYGGLQNRLFVYYKALDSNGEEIPESKTVATNFKKVELKGGINYEVFGSWQAYEIASFENFAKIEQISKEEYEKK